jgi:hypothetical protein
MIEHPHWSYSALAQYLRCPRQYFFERVLYLPRRSCSAGQALGTAVHAALAAYHEGLRRAQPLSPQRIRGAAQDKGTPRPADSGFEDRGRLRSARRPGRVGRAIDRSRGLPPD